MTGNYDDIPYPPDYGAPHAMTPTPIPALDLDGPKADAFEELSLTAIMLETWAPECFPEVNEKGQKHFARVMMESAADAINAALASFRTQLAEANARAESWRCFHCDEVFTTREEAAAHFGYSECSVPACRINGGLAAAYRELEACWSRCQNECCDHLNAYHAKKSEHNQALIREEERGYSKGVADMRAELEAANARADKAYAERDEAKSENKILQNEAERLYSTITSIFNEEKEIKQRLADVTAELAAVKPVDPERRARR